MPLVAKDLVAVYREENEEQRMKTIERAQAELTNSQMKIFKREIKSIEDNEKAEKADDAAGDGEEDEEEEEEIEMDTPPESSKTGGGKGKQPARDEKVEEKIAKDNGVKISDSEAEKFWKELEGLSGEDLLNESVIMDFQYVGFDPNVILKSIIQRGKVAKRTNDQIISDIATMCTIAIIKGSVTDNNLKKMSDPGKKRYGDLEAMYGLKRNGSRGVSPDVVTIARVGAAFPGPMMKILLQRPDLSKKFSGPFGSKLLPSYLRHQSAAACIPETLDEAAKSFLIGLICAYTSDQSRSISKAANKDTASDVYDRQENFITQTHSSHYPSEDVRKSIFKSWSLAADYDKLKSVGDNITKVVKTFVSISKEDLVKAVTAV
jgi:hypothetical protein